MKISDVIKLALSESQGGIAKRWLESQKTPIFFTDSNNNRYTIDNMIVFPLKVPVLPIEELGPEVEETITKMGIDKNQVGFVNKMPLKQGAGALVIMKDENDTIYPIFKFFAKRTMDALGVFWQTSDFAKETGLAWEQTRMVGKAGQRQEEVISRIELKPLDVVPTNTQFAISAIPGQAADFMTSKGMDATVVSQLKQLLENARKGVKDVVPGTVPYERDIRVDFGEVASPLALISGKLATGSYRQVEAELLTPLGASWANATTVFYPAAGNEPLYDSMILWPNGEKLRISNKAEGKGGAASTVSILEVIDKYPERFNAEDQAAMAEGGKYHSFIQALRAIKEAKSYEGPVRLAIEFGYITAEDGKNALENLASKTNDAKLLTPKLQQIIQDPTIFDAQKDKPDYKICYHAIASLARLVVKHLNQDVPLTTEFFKFILSRANLIQVNQFTHRGGTGEQAGVGWDHFDVVWPPVFTGKIKFSASDFQSNKKPTSRLAFKT
jgi:hypothetical protein